LAFFSALFSSTHQSLFANHLLFTRLRKFVSAKKVSFGTLEGKTPGVGYLNTSKPDSKSRFQSNCPGILNSEIPSQKARSIRANPERKSLHIMTKPAVESVAPQSRCSHRFPASGHQCRLLATDPQSGLCAHHLARKKALDRDADSFFPLMQQANRFQNAQAINKSLNHLYDLLARARISARRAATLAYISSLLLRTLPAIDNDIANGIRDAAAEPPSQPAPAADPTEKSG
jgi:hypothetical protein